MARNQWLRWFASVGGALMLVLAYVGVASVAAQELPEPHREWIPGGERSSRTQSHADELSTSIRDVSFANVFTSLDSMQAVMREHAKDASARETVVWRDPYWGSAEITSVHWVAPNLAHRTLNFEDVALERFGVSWGPCFQPIVSGVRFYWDAATAPLYQLHGSSHAVEYVLGYPRIGSPPTTVWMTPLP